MKQLYLFVLFCLALTLPALSQTWTGAASNDWDDASNWSPNTVPAGIYNVIIPATLLNQPVISTTGAVAKSVEVQSGATLTIQSTGTLAVNGANYFSLSTAFFNNGTVENSGQLLIGNVSTTGIIGLRNDATFNNNTGGQISIDRATNYGLYNRFGTFTNAGILTIGATASNGNNGLYNSATFNNNAGGQIRIDNSAFIGLRNIAGTFTNAAAITIGATASNGQYGLVNDATFNNNTGGQISIDRSTLYGLVNNDGTFTNAATIAIGAAASVGTYGLMNFATFNNNTGGQISIDSSTVYGLYNDVGTFTNAATIIIGAVDAGGYGLYNYRNAIFYNSGCGALLKISSDAIITDVNGATTTNSGTIIENASGNSNIATNTGTVQNLNGGTFTITNNTGVLTTAPGIVWKGCTSTDWNTASNWNTGTVPTAIDDAVILPAANQPAIGTATAAVAHSVDVQGSSVLTNNGSLTINGSKQVADAYGGVFNGTAAFFNNGTVNNNGQLVIGNLAPVGQEGLYNYATFNNNSGGTIHIDNAAHYGLLNYAGTFTNASTITIGATAATGSVGLENNANTTFNNTGGAIHIDNITLYGLLNHGTFTNGASLVIGANAPVGQYGLTNQGTFYNNTSGQIHIDNTTAIGLLNPSTGNPFTNAGSIVIGANTSVGTGLNNTATFTNSACASLTLFAPLNNGYSFANQGLMTINTAVTHTNYSGFTNEGIIAYPQGNPIPNVTNNDIIIIPKGTCSTSALQIGGSNHFTVGTTWYTNPALTTVAGTYSAATNTFTATGLTTGTVYPLYFTVSDATSGNCSQTASITDTAQTCGSCANATNLTTSNITASKATLNWVASVNPVQWQVQYKSTAPGSKWTDVAGVTPAARSVTISGLKARQTYQWHIRAMCGKTWTAYSNALSFNTLASTLSITDASTVTEKPVSEKDGLQVTALPNPSTTSFTLVVRSASSKPVHMQVVNAMGQVLENRSGVPSTGSMQVGGTYRPGLYIAEVVQGTQRVIVKLLKQ